MSKQKWSIRSIAVIFFLGGVALGTGGAYAWDEDGHVIVTRLACAKLPDNMPDWIKTPEVQARLAYLCAEPDRWRGQHNVNLDHDNDPNHYMDIDDLPQFDLTLDTIPKLRREFTDLLATKRAATPNKFASYNRSKDKNYTNLTPGLLPYEIAELQWTIAASWTQLKTYEKYPDLATEEMRRNARENIIYTMGIIAHFVGDGAQPLHTTQHHHGWVGPNPKGYTTKHNFHQEIDGGVIDFHDINYPALISQAKPPRKLSTSDDWKQILAYLNESHQLVEPLYAMEKTGQLRKPEGKKFIEDRLLEGGSMLAGVWVAAFEASHIDQFRVNWLKNKKGRGAGMPNKQPAPVEPAATN